MAIQRLTAAYRSRSRPSSTLGAKASTTCPYYLDGDRGKVLADFSHGRNRANAWRRLPDDFSGVSPDSSRSEKSARISPKAIATRQLPDTRVIGYCAVFKVREEAQLARRSSGLSPGAPAASRSLKTQQHACNRLAPIALGEIHPNATVSPL